MTASLHHEASGRSLRALLILSLVWLAALSLRLWLDAHPLIVLTVLATTMPAVWDFIRDRRAWLVLDDRGLSWESGPVQGDVALAQLDHVRMETRLDMTVRVRLVLHDRTRVTLPQDCLPRPSLLEEALISRGLRVEKHHFGLM